MKLHDMVSLVLLACLGAGQAALGQTVDEYQGKYDLNHTAISVDLQIFVTPQKYSTVVIPVSLDITLENEQVPMSEVEFILDQARAFMEKMGFPAQLEARIVMGLENALAAAVEAINEKMVDLPDQMALAKSLPKGNMVSGTFADLDGQGRQFSLSGFLIPETGELDLSSLFVGVIDLETGSGAAAFTTGDFDVAQEFKGIKFEVKGIAEAEAELGLLE